MFKCFENQGRFKAGTGTLKSVAPYNPHSGNEKGLLQRYRDHVGQTNSSISWYCVTRWCNYHARVICHIRHLLMLEGPSTDACMQPDSLENRLLQLCAVQRSIQKVQRVQNNVASVVLQAPRRSDVNSLLRRCIGCMLNSASTISWPCWRSRLSRRHLRSIWTSTSRCAPAHATLDRRPSHCCACHFDEHHLPDDRSALSHLWLGTHCHLPY